ncbi:MAG: efflux RND transporter periplasmic adaptor subunit [Rhodobacteraceae bacterium]|nr:efflux RND transporter periplasmic adaptor subunit [Paracoccaceae bacterium]MCF8516054.1 efflux RND transporter periplasmic adaptor subunit [Paracoccaceae bacterium]MCF8520393.1 efflux RND transporter periplasmic adaptor subunit [Paracoccaceae bacterium]
MRPLLITSLFVTVLGIAQPGIAETANAATDPAPAAKQAFPAISVTTIGNRVLQDRAIVTGLIAPVETVLVAPLIEGQPIEKLLADVGDFVTEGQVLAVLSKTTLDLQKSQFAASLASARATIAQVEAQLVDARSSAAEAQRVKDRTAKLRAQGSASQAAADTANAAAISATARVTVAMQSLEAARAQLAFVEAQLANVDLQLSRTEVKAPVSGEITERNAQVGAVASAAGQPMFRMNRDGALELNADVSETDLLRLRIGQTAVLHLVGGTEPLSGTVRLIEPTIDAASRLGRARIEVNEPRLVRAGMYVEAEVLIDERDTLAVPVTAVGSMAGNTTVMRIKDNMAEQVVVTAGIRDGGWVEIQSGLEVGDVVVTKAGAFVRDGDHINPIPDMN